MPVLTITRIEITSLLRTVLLIAFVTVIVQAQNGLTYRVEYPTAGSLWVRVVIVPQKTLKGPVTLVIPRAIPGGYTQVYYDRYVQEVKATSSTGTAVKIEREDGPRWRVGSAESEVARVQYSVDLAQLEDELFDASSASKSRTDYLGLLGYSVLGYLDGQEDGPIRLEVVAPNDWPVFTTLAPKAPAEKGKTVADAENFYTLADSQIAMGPGLQVKRLEASVPLFLVAYSEVDTDLNRHGELLADAFHKVLAYFAAAPFAHYTAYIEILKPVSARHEYGFSMEHLESSTYFLGLDRAIKATTTPQELARDRFNFAHHIAHSWIPKRVYGIGYLPFSWELAPLIDTIWFNEGFARYAAIEALADALPEKEGKEYRQRQLDGLRRLLEGMPQFLRAMPLVELSRIGSLLYGADFRTGRTLFAKGALMAAEMDARIRERTNGQKRLRDSLRALVKWGEQSRRPFRIDELPGLIARPAGVDEQEIKAIMERWLRSQ